MVLGATQESRDGRCMIPIEASRHRVRAVLCALARETLRVEEADEPVRRFGKPEGRQFSLEDLAFAADGRLRPALPLSMPRDLVPALIEGPDRPILRVVLLRRKVRRDKGRARPVQETGGHAVVTQHHQGANVVLDGSTLALVREVPRDRSEGVDAPPLQCQLRTAHAPGEGAAVHCWNERVSRLRLPSAQPVLSPQLDER